MARIGSLTSLCFGPSERRFYPCADGYLTGCDLLTILQPQDIEMSGSNISNLYDKLKDMMQLLRSKANDIHDELRNEELQARKKRRSEVSLWLEQVSGIDELVQSIETEVEQVGYFGRGNLMKKLQEMTERVERLLKQSEFPRGLLLDDLNPCGLRLVTEKLEGSTPSWVEDQVWSCFKKGETRVGLYGMGGVGKTSLSKHINNKILKQNDLFNHVYYVTVTRETSVLKLQHDIAKAFGVLMAYEDEPKRAAELSMALEKREKSLLILDDVWEDLSVENIGVSVQADGCKLLVTTRRKDLCWKMKCFPVKMELLSKGESWDLFKKKLGNYESLSDEAKHIAGLVAKECAGLPLGIITVAGSMRGEISEHVWRDALRMLRNPCSSQQDMHTKVFSILRFSYDRLPDEKHRKSFLFCALYPDVHKIEREELISQLIAVGLVGGGSRLENIDKGHTLLNDLVNASLLECVTNLYSRRCVRMHDLVRDMAIKIMDVSGLVMGGIGLTEVPGELQWIKYVEWVSLMTNSIYHIAGKSHPNCPNLSALLLQGNPLSYISSSFFEHMIGLKVLNLSRTSIEVLPASVSDLVNLNSLLLFDCRELQIIPSLANMTKLREMLLQGCSCIEKIPDGMDELVNLEYLNLRSTKITGLSDGVFFKLQNLEVFVSNNEFIVLPNELMSLRHLKSFMGHSVPVCWLNQCVDFGCFDQWTSYFFGPFSCEYYKGKGYNRVIVVKEYRSDIRKECCVSVPRNAQFLQFKDCNFGVRSLLDALPSLCDAADMKLLELSSCVGFEYIFSDQWSKPLEVVQELKLFELDDFCGLIREEVVRPHISFCGLRRLEISGCSNMKRLWLLNLELPNMQLIRIEDCGQMEEIFATKEGGTIELPNLRSLALVNLLELRSIWRANVLLPRLLDLLVTECPKVRKLGLSSHKIPSLAEMEVSDCEQMEEIFEVEDEAGDVAIHFLNLRRIMLWYLPELRRICRRTIVCNSLQLLELDGCSSGERLENCPISVSRQSVVDESYIPPVLRAWDKPRDWWDSLHWNDSAAKALLKQLRCLHVD